MSDAQDSSENRDYYFDPDGKFVLTSEFLKKRGFCCQNGCRHCPYPKAEVKRE